MFGSEGQIERSLASGLVRRVRYGLGGSHTVVTYPPLAALRPVGDIVERAMAPASALNLYFHLPYCEHVCAFCHYAKSLSPIGSTSEEMRAYLGALEGEMDRRRALIQRSTVRSIYIGGGTPTVLPTNGFAHLLDRILDLAGRDRPKLCVEVSPQTIMGPGGAEKVALMREAGVDRISLGVQTFSDRLLQRHRGHRQRDVLAACDTLLATGIETNIDLLQDLPGQTWQDLSEDCAWIDRLKPAQLTWYVLRAERGSIWYKAIRDGRLEDLPDDAASASRRLRVFDAMEAIGYRAESGGRFLRNGVAADHYKQVRSGIDQTLLGFGLSSYSHGWGWFFRNVHHQSARAGSLAYVSRHQQGVSPIETGLPVTASERSAADRLHAFRTILPQAALDDADPEGQVLLRLLDALLEADLVRHVGTGWTLSRVGRAFEEEILSLFYSQNVRRSLASNDAYWATGSARLADLLGLSDRTYLQETEHVAASLQA